MALSLHGQAVHSQFDGALSRVSLPNLTYLLFQNLQSTHCSLCVLAKICGETQVRTCLLKSLIYQVTSHTSRLHLMHQRRHAAREHATALAHACDSHEVGAQVPAAGYLFAEPLLVDDSIVPCKGVHVSVSLSRCSQGAGRLLLVQIDPVGDIQPRVEVLKHLMRCRAAPAGVVLSSSLGKRSVVVSLCLSATTDWRIFFTSSTVNSSLCTSSGMFTRTVIYIYQVL